MLLYCYYYYSTHIPTGRTRYKTGFDRHTEKGKIVAIIVVKEDATVYLHYTSIQLDLFIVGQGGHIADFDPAIWFRRFDTSNLIKQVGIRKMKETLRISTVNFYQ